MVVASGSLAPGPHPRHRTAEHGQPGSMRPGTFSARRRRRTEDAIAGPCSTVIARVLALGCGPALHGSGKAGRITVIVSPSNLRGEDPDDGSSPLRWVRPRW
jgi:hypothetical protein